MNLWPFISTTNTTTLQLPHPLYKSVTALTTVQLYNQLYSWLYTSLYNPTTDCASVQVIPSFGERYLSTMLFADIMDEAKNQVASLSYITKVFLVPYFTKVFW